MAMGVPIGAGAYELLYSGQIKEILVIAKANSKE